MEIEEKTQAKPKLEEKRSNSANEEKAVCCKEGACPFAKLKSAIMDPFTNIIGIMASLLIMFLFPFSGVSTLMHAVLHFPGPGAGIAFPIGTMLVAFALASYALTKNELAPFWVSTIFGIVYNLLSSFMGGVPFGPFQNRLGAALFFGLVMSGTLLLLKGKGLEVRYFVSSSISNLAYLAIFWLIVFPYGKGMVKPTVVPILSALAIAGGLAGAIVPYLYARAKVRKAI